MSIMERFEAHGEARGRFAERADILIEQLTDRFGELTAEQTGRIESADLDQLKNWTLQVLSAGSVDEALT